MNAAIPQTGPEPWLIDVDGTTYRWTIWAYDNGLELRVLDNERGGTLLIIDGLFFEPGEAEWRIGHVRRARFNTLPDNKVAELIRQARANGWRFDLSEPTFRLERSG